MDALDEKSAEAEPLSWRGYVWCVLATLAIGPIFWGGVALVVDILRAKAGYSSFGWPAAAVTSLIAGYGVYHVIRWRLRYPEPFTLAGLFGWMVFAGVTAVLTQGVYDANQKIHASQIDRRLAANVRKLEAAEQKIFEADSGHLIFTYDEIVGPGRPVESLDNVIGEDYHGLYPRHFGQTYAVVAKNHPLFLWQVSLTSTNPPGNWDNPRGFALPGGGRLETTVTNSGLPDGPVRFFRPDGKVYAEAVCKDGHLIDHTIYPAPAAGAAPRAAQPFSPPRPPMLAAWTVMGTGQSDWQRTEVTVTGATSSGDGLLVSPESYGDVTFSATVNTSNREASLAVRMQDAANGYLVVFIPNGLSWNKGSGGLWFMRRQGGVETSLGGFHHIVFPSAGQAAQLSVVAAGATFKIRLNGNEVIRVTDATFATGRVGFRIYGDRQLPCSAAFTDVAIK